MASSNPRFIDEMLSIFDLEDVTGRVSNQRQLMNDDSRINSFIFAIKTNKQLFEGKVVLEIASGMGILSMFAAKAGARKVYALEASTLAYCASKIVKDNGLDDIITVIRGRINEIELPDNVQTVDIIIADWTGYCMYYRNLLKKVLYARDKWLAPGGVMFPDRCSLFIQGMDSEMYQEEHVDWWQKVYGFKMSPIYDAIQHKSSAVRWWCDDSKLITNACLVKEVDMYTEKLDSDTVVNSSFCLRARRNDSIMGFLMYYNVEFRNVPRRYGYSTGPLADFTYYGQLMFSLNDHLLVTKDEKIYGKVEIESGCCKYKSETYGLDLFLSVDWVSGKNQQEVHVNRKKYCISYI